MQAQSQQGFFFLLLLLVKSSSLAAWWYYSRQGRRMSPGWTKRPSFKNATNSTKNLIINQTHGLHFAS